MRRKSSSPMNWVFQPINLLTSPGDRTHDLASKIGIPNLSASSLACWPLRSTGQPHPVSSYGNNRCNLFVGGNFYLIFKIKIFIVARCYINIKASQLAERFGFPILLARSWVRSPVRSVNLWWAEIPNSLKKRTTSSSQCGFPGGLGESPGLAGVLRGSLYIP